VINLKVKSEHLPYQISFNAAKNVGSVYLKHSKHPKYNGVIFSLVGRDDNGQNVMLATALVNVGSESNITWFLNLCVEPGLSFNENAVFCDRGSIRGATCQLYQAQGVRIEL
jgi:hypothetical protein